MWFECGGPSENTYWPGWWLIALVETSCGSSVEDLVRTLTGQGCGS